MATPSENLQSTRAGSIDSSGKRTLQRHFTVSDTAPYTLTEAIADMDAHIPYLSTYLIGTDYATGLGVVATYYGAKSWSRPEGINNAWEFVLTYSTAPSEGGGATGENALITTQGDTRATTKAVYRVGDMNLSMVDSPNASTDIGGTPVDQGGVPTSITTIDRKFSTTEKMVNFPLLNALGDLVGKRNEDGYEGGEEGSILYLGFSWNYDTSNGLWVVNHQFAVDKQTHHAEQVAKTDPQSDIIVERVNIGGEEIYYAKHVYWVQPFEQAVFAGLLPDF
tara:strand:+ start:142 stop:978 length:837 start_codon:yes stop_codon:yes gene_type:complete